MLNGLNSLRLSLMSLNRRRVKKMLLLMHCLVVILCFHNLTLKYLVWRPSKINMCMMLNLKMFCRIVKKGEHGTSSLLMMDLCFVLTSYAFQLRSSFVAAGGAWRRINGTLWREEDGGY